MVANSARPPSVARAEPPAASLQGALASPAPTARRPQPSIMARCCTRYFRCGCCDECTACCLWPAEKQIRATADRLFDTVNQDTTCCGCKDEVLSKTEVMLLMRMLQDEGRDTLRQHRGLIAEIINQLRAKTAADSEGGADVTLDEMRDVLLSATSRYQTMAVDAIAAELQRDYANMGEATPAAQTMERGGARRGRGRRAPLLAEQ